ncbi:hypothetical protein SAY87_028829 [Trapa incisa]|uniref:C2 NT-type domain-containing protein n=1 Tax=Trapa incisa TaxID=236973 RepID=A0AAN7QSE2_9MYRT|nr:hypothetical protein SAY87_028829 [Trapa incisa]
MVLGLRSKSRKCVSIQVEYLVHVERIKPWPSLQSLKVSPSLLIQWENGNQSSGSFRCSVSEGQIEIGKSFKLPVTLYQEASKKRSTESFQKNFLEFQLYESYSDKAVKGQLLGSAAINLAEYGVSRETLKLSASVSCKKSLKNIGQPPLLYVSIEPLQPVDSSSSQNIALLKDGSLEKGGSGTISPLAKDADDEVEISSFTDDDDVSTHSPQVIPSAAPDATGTSLSQKNGEEPGTFEKDKAVEVGEGLPLRGTQSLDTKEVHSHKTDTILKDLQHQHVFSREDLPLRGTQSFDTKEVHNHKTDNILKDLQLQHEVSSSHSRSLEQKQESHQGIADENGQKKSAMDLPELDARSKTQSYNNTWMQNKVSSQEFASNDELTASDIGEKEVNGYQGNGQLKQLGNTASRQITFRKGAPGDQSSIGKSNALKRAKSTFVPPAISDSTELLVNSHTLIRRDGPKAALSSASNSKVSNNEAKLESKVAMLEEELREAAALEVSLYSVVAEHGSSLNKVYSPARRLSRFYIHACQTNLHSKRVNAAKAIVSGLALVSKACGNDVPRLTFWLSNTIALRAIASYAAKKSSLSAESRKDSHGNGRLFTKSSPSNSEHLNDWENPQAFALALEKVEAWMFSRIVESVWWQTMTPHMQSSAAKRSSSSSRKSQGRKHMLSDIDQGSHSIELWKKAFTDACERLCPVRAGGHECACLPLLTRLVMEQLVGRLDVAMFNAILRESADEMPTDPVSDPITEPKVLPIPAGRSGFGAGVQLKNAIGSWSQWLSDIFGVEEDDTLVESNGNSNIQDTDSSFKAFHLLNALSDLMMLPFEMLANGTTRKEVCPAFGIPLIKRCLYNFVPDEFCPDPVPHQVLEALDAEEHYDADNSFIVNIPYIAPTTLYSSPPASSISSITGDMGSGKDLLRSNSSALRKSYTSDDDLDELFSPIASIILDKSRVSPASSSSDWMLKGKGGRKVVRYQLLREVWKDCE